MPNLKFTLKAWPVIAGATIGLCFLTKAVAGWFGVELAEQANIEIVRRCAGWNLGFILICAQVLVAMPALEEAIFRWLLFKLPAKRLGAGAVAAVSSAMFSAAHYLQQPWPDDAFLALFFFALAQCWLYRRTGRLWCAMLNHALFNLVNLVLLFLV